MNHKAELARLPAWVRPIIAGLLEHPPQMVAEELSITDNRVRWARRVGWRVLGQRSPLMAATSRHKRGPATGSTYWGWDEMVTLITTPGPDGHVHVARFDGSGNGHTDLVAGHQHRVRELELAEVGGHRHDLTDQRA